MDGQQKIDGLWTQTNTDVITDAFPADKKIGTNMISMKRKYS